MTQHWWGLWVQETVAEYNAGVEAGEDPLGKPLGRDVQPLAEAPFYATRLWPKVHHCMGGVGINHSAQVCLSTRPPGRHVGRSCLTCAVLSWFALLPVPCLLRSGACHPLQVPRQQSQHAQPLVSCIAACAAA